MKELKDKRKWLIWVTAIVLTAFFVGAGPTLAAGAQVGSLASDFTLEDIYGTTHSLSDYAGTVVVLAFLSDT